MVQRLGAAQCFLPTGDPVRKQTELGLAGDQPDGGEGPGRAKQSETCTFEIALEHGHVLLKHFDPLAIAAKSPVSLAHPIARLDLKRKIAAGVGHAERAYAVFQRLMQIPLVPVMSHHVGPDARQSTLILQPGGQRFSLLKDLEYPRKLPKG